MTGNHVPVMVREVIKELDPRPGWVVLDATVGAGGHSGIILEKMGSKGHVIGIDRDPEMITLATRNLERFGSRVDLVAGHYADLDRHLDRLGIRQVDAVLFDLGLSSYHLDQPRRGFGFRFSAPLDMRFDQSSGSTAADILNARSHQDLTKIFRNYGGEQKASAIARAVVRRRAVEPFKTTDQIRILIEKIIPGKNRRIHPATRVFQALRIAVNQELARLQEALIKAVNRLRPKGRIAVIAYHSGEDQIVKQTFHRLAARCVCPPDSPICVCDQQPLLRLPRRKIIRPAADEIASNPRSRSARLRVAERLS